jgi:hypothetical protein
MMYAESVVGVKEDFVDGKWTNWGPKVQEFLKAAEIDRPAAWCAGLVQWCAEQAAYDHGVISPLETVKLQAYTPSYFEWAKHNNKFVTFEEAGLGDLFILYYPSLNRYGHIGLVEEVNVEEGWFSTIEGNTGLEGEREGYMVAKRRRTHTVNVKFIRWA